MKLNNNILTNIKNQFNSVRVKLFATLCVTIAVIIVFVILMNSVVLESYYMFSKQATLLRVYKGINAYYNGLNSSSNNIELELEKLALSNDLDILIKTDTVNIYASNKNFGSSIPMVENFTRKKLDSNLIYSDDNVEITKTIDNETEMSFIMLSATLDNGYQLFIRIAVASIQENVKIANKFLMLIGMITMIVSGMIVLVISNKFTSPIAELNKITKKISKLDFSHKYNVNDSEDELNNLR